MEDKKVTILMSTYNGEKYLEEQIDSLLNQTYKNISILIRDDGSKDNTVHIIKEKKKSNDNITLIEGKNVGFIKSFLELINLAEKSDYYAYCDQDDVWMEEKIQRAVEFFEMCGVCFGQSNKSFTRFGRYFTSCLVSLISYWNFPHSFNILPFCLFNVRFFR